MKDGIVFIVFICLVIMIGLAFVTKVIDIDRDFNINDARERLRIIADTTLSSSDNWEPVVSEDEDVGVDHWGTETRLLYIKCPDMSVVVAVSAGPNGIWDDLDDIAEVAFASDRDIGVSND